MGASTLPVQRPKQSRPRRNHEHTVARPSAWDLGDTSRRTNYSCPARSHCTRTSTVSDMETGIYVNLTEARGARRMARYG